MDCDICESSGRNSRGFHCPACARALLYSLRIHNAQALLTREKLEAQVASVNDFGKDSKTGTVSLHKSAKSGSGLRGIETENRQLEASYEAGLRTQDRIEELSRQAEDLRRRMKDYHERIDARKKANEKHREELRSAKEQSRLRQSDVRPNMVHQVSTRSSSLRNIHIQLSSARIYLCHEAAALLGLKSRQRQARPDGKTSTTFFVGGIHIPDLRNLTERTPEQLTTSLNYVIRLLVLICEYLSVRLPAEIIHPHADYPYATIFSPMSSYTHISNNHSFPTPYLYTPNQGNSASSPKTSRELEKRNLPRPRPLFVFKQLPVLAKEDPAGYALFLEGISLLAWDIAWLCRSQGLTTAEKDWDDIAAMGWNLWHLLVSAAPNIKPPELKRQNTSHQNNPIATARTSADENPRTNRASALPAAFGVYSHASAKNFLGAPMKPDLVRLDTNSRGWKYANPAQIVDKLKANLLNEMSVADWEVLEDADYTLTEPVEDSQARGQIEEGAELKDPTQIRKVNGWTKLRERPLD